MHFSHTFFHTSLVFRVMKQKHEGWSMAISRGIGWRFRAIFGPKFSPKLLGNYGCSSPAWDFDGFHGCQSCCDQLAPTPQAQLIPWCHRPSHLSRQVFQVDIFAPYPTIGSVRRFNMTLFETLWDSLKINGSARNIQKLSKLHVFILLLIKSPIFRQAHINSAPGYAEAQPALEWLVHGRMAPSRYPRTATCGILEGLRMCSIIQLSNNLPVKTTGNSNFKRQCFL